MTNICYIGMLLVINMVWLAQVRLTDFGGLSHSISLSDVPTMPPTTAVLTAPVPGTVIGHIHVYSEEQVAQIEALREVCVQLHGHIDKTQCLAFVSRRRVRPDCRLKVWSLSPSTRFGSVSQVGTSMAMQT